MNEHVSVCCWDFSLPLSLCGSDLNLPGSFPNTSVPSGAILPTEDRPKLLLLHLPAGPVPVPGLLCFPRLSSDAWWHQRVSCSRWNTGAPCSNVVTVAKGICAACFEGRPLAGIVEDDILKDNRFYSGSAYLVAELTLHRDLGAGAPWRQLSAVAEEMRRGRILFYVFQSNKILAFSWRGIIWSDPSLCILSSILKRHFPSLCSPPHQLWSTTAKCPCMGPLCRPLWGHRLPGLGRVLKPPHPPVFWPQLLQRNSSEGF